MIAPLGVILAGGANTRYGAHKALVEVGGRRIIDRVRDALAHTTDRIVLVANDQDAYRDVGLAMRADARPGLGSLGGILTAVRWAEDEERRAALVVACDMPFVSGPLLRLLAERAGEAEVVVPESGGRRGVEPLCACYATSCAAAIEAALARDDRRVIAFYEDVRVLRLDANEVRRFGDPAMLFMNVNTPEERVRAESIESEARR
jgi:molybdopterin-guanine dinucleotide biosynthesis protein A